MVQVLYAKEFLANNYCLQTWLQKLVAYKLVSSHNLIRNVYACNNYIILTPTCLSILYQEHMSVLLTLHIEVFT